MIANIPMKEKSSRIMSLLQFLTPLNKKGLIVNGIRKQE